MSLHFVAEVLELDRDCELGQAGERCVVVALFQKYMMVVFPMRNPPQRREVRTGQDYSFLKSV